eukprot:Skav214429  [mRNA]  locus=scaffold586:331181:342892:+ [translate_table: standard]
MTTPGSPWVRTALRPAGAWPSEASSLETPGSNPQVPALATAMARSRSWLIRCLLLLSFAWLLQFRSAWVPSTGRSDDAPVALHRRSASVVLGALLPISAAEAEVVKGANSDRNVVLQNGLQFPKASFGLQVYDDDTAERLTLQAIEAGDWDEPFSWRVRYTSTKEGCDKNLEALAEGGITEVDMILSLGSPEADPQEMKAKKQTKSLAVSNFSPEQLDCILADPVTRSTERGSLGIGERTEVRVRMGPSWRMAKQS